MQLEGIGKKGNEWWKEKVFSFAGNWIGCAYIFWFKNVSGGYICITSLVVLPFENMLACILFILLSKNVYNEKRRSIFCWNQSKKSNQSTTSRFALNLLKILNYFDELQKVCMKISMFSDWKVCFDFIIILLLSDLNISNKIVYWFSV